MHIASAKRRGNSVFCSVLREEKAFSVSSMENLCRKVVSDDSVKLTKSKD
jgi:hypothetical protein